MQVITIGTNNRNKKSEQNRDNHSSTPVQEHGFCHAMQGLDLAGLATSIAS
ncbi:MAG: hypothetical protein ACRYGK_17965 [Janthinobacterium lividum]